MLNDDTLMNTRQLCKYLGVTMNSLCELRMRGTGPKFLRIGRHIKYRAKDVREWMNKIATEKEGSTF